MKLAHDHNVPVMLQGQGGDELFFGYTWVQEAAKDSIRKYKLHQRGNATWKDYFEWSFPNISSPHEVLYWIWAKGGIDKARNLYKRDITNPIDQFVFIDLINDFHEIEECKENFYNPVFSKKIINREPYSIFTSPMPWKDIDIKITKLILRHIFLKMRIAQGDRLSMASSVELRLPLLNYKLVETVIGLKKLQRL